MHNIVYTIIHILLLLSEKYIFKILIKNFQNIAIDKNNFSNFTSIN